MRYSASGRHLEGGKKKKKYWMWRLVATFKTSHSVLKQSKPKMFTSSYNGIAVSDKHSRGGKKNKHTHTKLE